MAHKVSNRDGFGRKKSPERLKKDAKRKAADKAKVDKIKSFLNFFGGKKGK